MAKKVTRNRMKRFVIEEVSAVDRAAQVHANAVLLKRADSTEKSYGECEFRNPKMLSAVDGHVHLLDDDASVKAGVTTWDKSEGEESGHSHPWVRDEDGTVTIGMAEGHTHTINNPAAKSAKQETEQMDEKELEKLKKAAEESDRQRKAAEDALVLAKSYGALTDAEKSFHKSLPEGERDAFVKKSPEERANLVKAASDANAVVYTSASGEEFRKSDDPRLVRMAKSADESARVAKAERERNATLLLEKRADDETPHYPGEKATKVALLRAIDGITDDTVRAEVLKAIKAGETALAKAFNRAGRADAEQVDGDAETKLEKMARERAAKTNESFEKAYAAVCATPEGEKLLAEALENPLPGDDGDDD